MYLLQTFQMSRFKKFRFNITLNNNNNNNIRLNKIKFNKIININSKIRLNKLININNLIMTNKIINVTININNKIIKIFDFENKTFSLIYDAIIYKINNFE